MRGINSDGRTVRTHVHFCRRKHLPVLVRLPGAPGSGREVFGSNGEGDKVSVGGLIKQHYVRYVRMCVRVADRPLFVGR